MHDFDFVVIGSGFGGSVAAHRLSQKGYTVAVLEMGKRWTPDSLPPTNWSLRRWLWRPGLGCHGFFSIRFFRHAMVLHGCAVGGGSITYANTLLVPPEKVWDNGSWAALADWKTEMPRHYATASRMLGVTENKIMGPADDLLKQGAAAIGAGHTFYPTQVGVFQAPNGEAGGKRYPDPYFNGEGPERTTCIGCGACMVGCRHGAKNTLDLNYLYLAEKNGARVFAETKVVDVRPVDGYADGSAGYTVTAVRSTHRLDKRPRRFTCRGVIFAASALGTMELLFQLKERGALPALSEQIGKKVLTNCESLIGIRIPGGPDMSAGIAIGSGVHISEHTHIEATRYNAGSDALSFLSTLLTRGRPGPGRIGLWLFNMMASFLRRPLRTIQLLRPRGWARECLILLCMQALEGHISMRWKRTWYWPFSKSLVTAGPKVPAFIPEANAFAEKLAALSGGTAMSTVTEILFNIPTTAHLLGGCAIGATPEEGVVDQRHRVFGYKNMYICDGSVFAANLGVNPSLSIAALTERAMEFIEDRPPDGF